MVRWCWFTLRIRITIISTYLNQVIYTIYRNYRGKSIINYPRLLEIRHFKWRYLGNASSILEWVVGTNVWDTNWRVWVYTGVYWFYLSLALHQWKGGCQRSNQWGCEDNSVRVWLLNLTFFQKYSKYLRLWFLSHWSRWFTAGVVICDRILLHLLNSFSSARIIQLGILVSILYYLLSNELNILQSFQAHPNLTVNSVCVCYSSVKFICP